MKTLLSLIAVVGVFSIAAPAQAGHFYPHQHRIVMGYNPMGFPIYQWMRPGPPGHWGHYHHDNGLHRGWYKHR